MLKKILPRPGINKENTRYTAEGGWYDCDKIRFRQGTPEVIGGWVPVTTSTFFGTCRSLWRWAITNGNVFTSLGTHLKFYLNVGSGYYDITPLRPPFTATGIFTATNGSSTLLVTLTGHGAKVGDYVTFYGATGLGGNVTAAVLANTFQITFIPPGNPPNSFQITLPVTANASDTGNGGAVTAVFQVNVGAQNSVPTSGWGAGTWGSGPWGTGLPSVQSLRLWSQNNYGQDLVFAYKGGPLFYWYHEYGFNGTSVTIDIPSSTIYTALAVTPGHPVRFSTTGALPTGLTPGQVYYVFSIAVGGFSVSSTPGGSLVLLSGTQSGTHLITPNGFYLSSTSSDAPSIQNFIFISDQYKFVFAFGCNDVGATEQSPMLVRWCDQANINLWTPSITNQAGGIPLSRGSYLVSATQLRQEIFVLSDTAAYSMQYVGPPYVWSAQTLASNITTQGQNCIVAAAGVAYWMGLDKFYKYDGTVQTLDCDLKRYVFNDINTVQSGQIFAGTCESFNEVWWFYCSASSNTINRYVVYNYLENIWYHGSMSRTAWLDAVLVPNPTGATASNTLVYHEYGVDANETGTPVAMNAYITSAEFDTDDGQNFGFIWRAIPDITFVNSTTSNPYVTLTLNALTGSGSGYLAQVLDGSSLSSTVTRSASAPVEQYTNQVNIRARGRQFSMNISSNQLGTAWKVGSMRIDVRTDGRRG